MTSGGASRIVEPWVSLASTPKAASRSQTARPDSDANVTPAQRPRPVTDDTTDGGSDDSRSCSEAPSTADRCWYSPVRSIAITSRATAHASGFPPNVEPCWPGRSTPSTEREDTIADTGTIPPPSALPSRYASGTTPSASQANVVPTRPSPDWISSAIISAPADVHSDRSPARNPGGGTTTPASPWIGSTSTATTRCPYSAKARRTAPRSP